MTLDDLIQRFRTEADDKVAPLMWPTSDIAMWLNEAVEEAAIRARLLYDASTTAVTQITVVAGTSSYPLHDSLYEIVKVRFQATGDVGFTTLSIVSREYLDDLEPDWRSLTEEYPQYLVQDDVSITVAKTPEQSGTLFLEGYRLPLADMEDDDDAPEIGRAHHRHLVNWALYRAYSKPDAETYDATRSQKALQDFTDYFGERPDVDLRRITRHDVEHHNKAW